MSEGCTDAEASRAAPRERSCLHYQPNENPAFAVSQLNPKSRTLFAHSRPPTSNLQSFLTSHKRRVIALTPKFSFLGTDSYNFYATFFTCFIHSQARMAPKCSTQCVWTIALP